MPRYSNRWKLRTLKECGLTGNARAVFHALITVGDWKGRSHRPYRELAEYAGVSARTCSTMLHLLIDKGYVLELSKGKGRRPSWLQVVDCDYES